MSRIAPLLLGVLLLTVGLAGCLGDEAPDGAPPPASQASGLQVSAPVNVSTEFPGAEPVIDVGPDGTLYLEGVGTYEDPDTGQTRGVNKVFRSTDDGQSWTDITPQAIGQEETGDGYVAVGPDGTVFAANVFGLTFQILRSTDQGETWVPLNPPRVPALMHRHWIEPLGDGEVHVTVEALPPGAVPFLLGGPSAEGQADSQNQGMWYVSSQDNGDTWSTPQRIDPQINYAGQSDMAVSQDGQDQYIVRYEEDKEVPLEYEYRDGHYYLLSSHDGGETWERTDMFDQEGDLGSALTSLSLDPAGTLYFVWSQTHDGRSVTHLATSQDQGQTWTHGPLEVSDGTQAMPFADARGPGELVLLWYDAHAQGTTGQVNASWHMHTAHLQGAGTDEPTITVAALNGTVHQGNICVKGPTCSATDGDRRLLDYPWVAIGPDGRAHLAYASTMWDKPSAHPIYAQATLSAR